jgi:integrase
LCRNAVHGWNLAVKRIPAWPRRTLALPSCAKRIKLPLESFPSSFRADLERFTASLERPDPLDPEALFLSAASPRPSKLYQREVVRFASVLVHAGAPIGEIDGLAALVAPRRAELGLRWRLADNGGRRFAQHRQARGAAQGRGQALPARLRGGPEGDRPLGARLAVKRRHGMTPKNRARLRPLQDPATLRRLLSLPQRLFARGEANGDTRAGALEREDAVAIAILTTCPLRRRNLAELHLEENLHRPGDGRVFLVFREEEVKNARPIEFELPPETVRMIDRHLARRSPRLCPPATPWLFPRRDGSGPVHEDRFGGRIKKRIWKETGLTVNPHLFRHLAAMLWLDAHPGEYEVARRLLGHRALSSTLDAYAGFEAGTATRLFAEVVDAARSKT